MDYNDELAVFSNYSATKVDLGAPGDHIWGTTTASGILGDASGYRYFSWAQHRGLRRMSPELSLCFKTKIPNGPTRRSSTGSCQRLIRRPHCKTKRLAAAASTPLQPWARRPLTHLCSWTASSSANGTGGGSKTARTTGTLRRSGRPMAVIPPRWMVVRRRHADNRQPDQPHALRQRGTHVRLADRKRAGHR